MQFGLVVTDKRHAAHAAGLIAASVRRGWDARCFLTDTGVCLVQDEGFMALARERPQSVAVCKHSLDHFLPEVDSKNLSAWLVVGGQYQGAKLAQSSQTVMVL